MAKRIGRLISITVAMLVLATLAPAAAAGLTADSGAAAPVSAIPVAAPTPAPVGQAVPAPDQACPEVPLLESPEGMAVAGLELEGAMVATAAAAALPPPCPEIYSGCTSGGGLTCRAGSCTTTRLGSKACALPDGRVIKCAGGKTLYVTTCSTCSLVFRDACCTATPACLCRNSCGTTGNQSVMCQ